MSGALINKALSAAGKGDLATLKALKDQIDLNHTADKFGATPVHYAARAGKVDCIRWLVQSAGLSGNKSANNGATPAHDAAATGQIDCLQWLVQYGGCGATARDSCGATPLHLGKVGGAQTRPMSMSNLVSQIFRTKCMCSHNYLFLHYSLNYLPICTSLYSQLAIHTFLPICYTHSFNCSLSVWSPASGGVASRE